MENNTKELHPLLRRAILFLEEENWASADDYCERYLDTDPECAYAYVIKLMARVHVSREEDLVISDRSFKSWNSYISACRFADTELLERLQGYADAVDVKLIAAEEERQRIANEQEKLEIEAKNEKIYSEAVALHHSDSINDMIKAMKLYRLITDYKDVMDLTVACKKKIDEKKKENELHLKEEKIKKRKTIKKTILICFAILIIGFAYAQVMAQFANNSLAGMTFSVASGNNDNKIIYSFQGGNTVKINKIGETSYVTSHGKVFGWFFGIMSIEINGKIHLGTLDLIGNVSTFIVDGQTYYAVDQTN